MSGTKCEVQESGRQCGPHKTGAGESRANSPWGVIIDGYEPSGRTKSGVVGGSRWGKK